MADWLQQCYSRKASQPPVPTPGLGSARGLIRQRRRGQSGHGGVVEHLSESGGDGLGVSAADCRPEDRRRIAWTNPDTRQQLPVDSAEPSTQDRIGRPWPRVGSVVSQALQRLDHRAEPATELANGPFSVSVVVGALNSRATDISQVRTEKQLERTSLPPCTSSKPGWRPTRSPRVGWRGAGRGGGPGARRTRRGRHRPR